MWTAAETARQRSAAIAQAIDEKQRKLKNIEFYIEATAPCGPAESAASHKWWLDAKVEITRDLAELESRA